MPSAGECLQVVRPPAPGQALGVPVQRSQYVPPVVLAAGLLSRPGTVIDIGAGTGEVTAFLAAWGADVRAFEPHPVLVDQLHLSLDPAWTVRIERLAVGPRSEVSGLSSVDGPTRSSLVGVTDDLGEVRVATPTEVIEETDARELALLSVSTGGFEMDVLRGFPWTQVGPDVVLVETDDGRSPGFGFRSRDVASLLTREGYAVAHVCHRRVNPRWAEQVVVAEPPPGEVVTHVIGFRAELSSVSGLELARRAILLSRVDNAARAAVSKRLTELSPAPVEEAAPAEPSVRSGLSTIRSRATSVLRRARRRLLRFGSRVRSGLSS